jgi:hypothetical protein
VGLTADDRLDLVELIHGLCQALDYSRPADFAAVFTPDGVYQAVSSAVSYVAFLQIDPETKERRITISGMHRDTFVRTPGGWRFTARTVVADI